MNLNLHTTVVLIPLLGSVLSANAQAPSAEELANLSYSGIYDEPVRLSDGAYEGPPFVSGGAARPRVALAEGLEVQSDLNGDGHHEAVVLLVESSGGSGENNYLAVVARSDGVSKNIATRLIGDRPKIIALRVEGAEVVLEYITAGPDEAACCPTFKVRKHFRLEGMQLVETNTEALGQLSIADLEGRTWMLTRLARQDSSALPGKVTASIEDGQITGSGGCNRYFADIESKAPWELSIGPVGATRRACQADLMDLEARYLKALQATQRYAFQLGKLSLSYLDGDSWQTMLFEAAE